MRTKNKLLIACLFIGLVSTFSCVECASETKFQLVNAVSVESTTETTTETISEDVKDDDLISYEDIKEWAKDQWNNIIMPIFVGFSATNIVVFLLNYIVSKIRNKIQDKKNKENQEILDEKLKQVQDCIIMVGDLVKTQQVIFEDLKNNNELSIETKELISLTMKNVSNLIKINNNKIDSIEKIKPILALFLSIEKKVALCRDEVVKSGIGDDIVKLESMVKELLTDEKENKNSKEI